MFSIRNVMTVHALSLAALPLVLAAFILGTAASAQAHRVNIFAWTEGDQVVAECGFNGGNKVKQGQVVVFDAATGAKIVEGLTDDQGVYRFSVPAAGKAHGVRIVIKAGEGHQNDWTMDAAELAAVQPADPASAAASAASGAASQAQTSTAVSGATPAATPAATAGTQPPATQKTDKAPAQQTANISAAELQGIVNTALDVKLGPIRKELAEMRVARPGFSEIFGGIGWLVGLAGIALYFKGRRG